MASFIQDFNALTTYFTLGGAVTRIKNILYNLEEAGEVECGTGL